MAVGRRDFLIRSGVGVGAGSLMGLAPWIETPAERSRGLGRWDPRSWASVREQFELSPDWVHLSGLWLSSHPAPVRDALERHRRGLDDNPVYYLQEEGDALDNATRQAAADYIGAETDEIGFTDSTTMGIGLVYNGLELRRGQDVLTSTHDHRVTHQSLRFKAARNGVRVRRRPLYADPAAASVDEIVGNMRENLRPETRVVAVTWVHSSTGVKLPIRAMADALAEANADRSRDERALLCVDGVHGFGVEDAGVRDLGCDLFMAGTHKWIMGPRGTGLLWGHPRAQRAVTPTIPTFTGGAGWGGRMTPGGFKPYEHRWALAQAFEFHREIGKRRVAERIHALNRQLKEGLAGMSHITLYTPMSDDLSSGITCFDVDGMAPAEVVARLRERGIVSTRTPYDPTYARLTPGLWNTPEEVERALGEIRAMG